MTGKWCVITSHVLQMSKYRKIYKPFRYNVFLIFYWYKRTFIMLCCWCVRCVQVSCLVFKMRFYLCFICVQALAAEEEGKGGGRQQEAVNCSAPGITKIAMTKYCTINYIHRHCFEILQAFKRIHQKLLCLNVLFLNWRKGQNISRRARAGIYAAMTEITYNHAVPAM